VSSRRLGSSEVPPRPIVMKLKMDKCYVVMSLKPFRILWKPFDRQFGDVVQSFRNHRDNLEKETALAHMIEEGDERIEQGYERTIARMGREAEEAAKQGKAFHLIMTREADFNCQR